MVKVVVIVVHYGNGVATLYTLNEVDSSITTMTQNKIPVYIVTNSKLSEQIPVYSNLECIVLNPEKNLGYGGAFNFAYAHIRKERPTIEYFWLLNNDVSQFSPNIIHSLTEVMHGNPELAAVSPKILKENGKVWFAGARVNIRKGLAVHGMFNKSGRTPFLTGCALFMSVKALENVGTFFEQYFLYWEDVDWSLRAIERGFLLGIVSYTTITHRDHGSSNGSTNPYYYLIRNSYIALKRHAPHSSVSLFLVRRLLRDIRAVVKNPRLLPTILAANYDGVTLYRKVVALTESKNNDEI